VTLPREVSTEREFQADRGNVWSSSSRCSFASGDIDVRSFVEMHPEDSDTEV